MYVQYRFCLLYSLILVIILQPKFMKKNITNSSVTMSSLQASSGVVNRMALPDPDIGKTLYD